MVPLLGGFSVTATPGKYEEIMAKVLVWIVGMTFVFYGIAFTLAPVEMSTLVTGDSPNTTSGIIDLRATYGGMSIAVGTTILFLARHDALLTLALLVTAFVLWAMAASRVLGMALDGSPNVVMYVYLVAELVVGCVALVLRRNITRLLGTHE